MSLIAIASAHETLLFPFVRNGKSLKMANHIKIEVVFLLATFGSNEN